LNIWRARSFPPLVFLYLQGCMERAGCHYGGAKYYSTESRRSHRQYAIASASSCIWCLTKVCTPVSLRRFD
jgi:hypothetical protein